MVRRKTARNADSVQLKMRTGPVLLRGLRAVSIKSVTGTNYIHVGTIVPGGILYPTKFITLTQRSNMRAITS